MNQTLASPPLGWALSSSGDAFERSFRFADFRTAFLFMTDVAVEAERLNHHPEWSNVFDHVHIRLTTHDADGVSPKDVRLAELINQLFSEGGACLGDVEEPIQSAAMFRKPI